MPVPTTSFRPLIAAPTLSVNLSAAWDGKSFWLLIADSGLWRSNASGTFEPVASGTDVLPAETRRPGNRLVALPDGELHVFAGPAHHGMFDGKRFVPWAGAPFTFTSAAQSAVAVDPKRGAIVVVDLKDGAIHEWKDGTWTKPGTLGLDPANEYYSKVAAAWDAAREVVVFLSNDASSRSTFNAARGWNGKTLESLPAPADFSVAPDHELVRGTTHPLTGRAVFLGKGLGVRHLGASAWEKVEGDDVPWINILRDVTAGPKGVVELWGASLYNESPAAQRITWDGKTWKRHGAVVPGWGGAADRSKAFAMSGTTLGHYGPDGDAWTTIETPEDGLSRAGAALAWDAANDRLLVTAGKAPPYGKTNAARDTWQWTAKKGWAELKVKGKPTAREDGRSVVAGAEMIVTGGVIPKKYVSPRVTDHFDGSKWTSYDERWEGGKEDAPVVSGIVWDPKSDAVFAVEAGEPNAVLWSYAGAGRWVRGIELSVPGGAGRGLFGFDEKTRRLAMKGGFGDALGTEGVLVAEIGPWLDALPKRSSLGAPAKKAVKAAKPEKRTVWKMKMGKKPGADRVGGAPPVDPPACRSCRKPMDLVAAFAPDEERLPKGLAIFMCESAGCKTWDPDEGANAAVFLKKAPKADGEGITFKKTTETFDDEASPGGSKIGGFPTWVQGPESPACPKCKEPMAFTLQLDHGDTGANFGDVGIGYAFSCPAGHAAKFLWQGS